MNANIKKRLLLYNLVFLILIFCYLLLKKQLLNIPSNWIFFPGADILTLTILGSYWVQLTPAKIFSAKCLIKLVLKALFYGIIYYVLKDLLILVLERFFRFQEHYSYDMLLNKWWNTWFINLEGTLFFLIYQVGIRFEYSRVKINLAESKTSKLENALTAKNLKSLRSELNPHFLYNAMNSISMMIRVKKYEESIDMIANLNELLRVVLYKSEEQLIPLSEELDILNKYLAIEQIRFGDSVEIKQIISEDTLAAKVPQLILQPMVENIFKHSMSESMGQHQIIIKTSKNDEQLKIQIFNNTHSHISIDLSHREHDEHKIGLQNVKNRLMYLYGSQFKFQLEEMNDGIEFRIIIPFDT